MIKRRNRNQVSVLILASLLLIGIGVSGIYYYFISESTNLNTLIAFFSILLFWIGISSIIDTLNEYTHPEKYVYCKKCKKVTSKEKNKKFCYHCFCDIEQAIKRSDLLKYKKDYLKQKKEKK